MKSKTRIALTSLVIILSLLMSVCLYIYSSFQRMQDNINVSEDINIPTTKEKNDLSNNTEKYATIDGITNILLIGVDDRLNSNSTKGTHSDAIMIATLDTIHNKLKLTSVMRDTYVTIPNHGNTKINHSHSYGGVALLISTIEENFGIPIDKYAKINFEGFKDVINTIDGVQVVISNEEMLNELNRCLLLEKYEDPRFKDSKFMKIVDKANLLWDREQYNVSLIKNNKHISKSEYNYIANKASFVNSTGTITLNGAQALAYSRMRHSVDGSVGRTSRQREVISLATKKISELSPTKYVPLAESIIPHIKTNISMKDAMSLGYTTLKINNFDIEMLQLPPEKLSTGVIVDKSFIYENQSIYVFLIDSQNTAKVAQDFIFNDIPYDESKYNTFNYINAGYYSPKKEIPKEEPSKQQPTEAEDHEEYEEYEDHEEYEYNQNPDKYQSEETDTPEKTEDIYVEENLDINNNKSKDDSSTDSTLNKNTSETTSNEDNGCQNKGNTNTGNNSENNDLNNINSDNTTENNSSN